MQIRQEIAGALFDFVNRLTALPEPLVIGDGAEPHRLLDIFRAWAADRGLDLDEADVAGWKQSLVPPEKPARHIPPGEELKCQIAEALGYDLDRHDITRMVITLDAGSANPILVTVEDMTRPDFEHDLVKTFKAWEIRPALQTEVAQPFAHWKPEEGGYKLVEEGEPR